MREYKLYVNDIKQAIIKIRNYTRGLSKEEFINDDKTYDSVLHNLMVIGEAAARIPDEIKHMNSAINWYGMTGMRNVIAHGYFSIDPEIIWLTVQERLPELLTQLDAINFD